VFYYILYSDFATAIPFTLSLALQSLSKTRKEARKRCQSLEVSLTLPNFEETAPRKESPIAVTAGAKRNQASCPVAATQADPDCLDAHQAASLLFEEAFQYIAFFLPFFLFIYLSFVSVQEFIASPLLNESHKVGDCLTI